MARFALRNQEKIRAAFGDDKLNSLLASLKLYFSKSDEYISGNVIDGNPYPTMRIGIATVYLTRIHYDVYHVALKNFDN